MGREIRRVPVETPEGSWADTGDKLYPCRNCGGRVHFHKLLREWRHIIPDPNPTVDCRCPGVQLPERES